MKVRPELFLTLFLFSCIYDPPVKGKEVSVHNQTDKALLVSDSLTGSYFKLYDTAKVNGRNYISRKPDFLTEFDVCQRFYSDDEMDSIRHKKNSKITLYFIDQTHLQNAPSVVLTNHSYRSFAINIDTLKKYELNHLFVTQDTILLEHDYDYYTNWRE